MPLPKELSNVILPHDKEGIALMNYREYLQNAFLLEETILIPFLAIIKDHLEKLQVDLGFIKTWILGKHEVLIFFKRCFLLYLKLKLKMCINTKFAIISVFAVGNSL